MPVTDQKSKVLHMIFSWLIVVNMLTASPFVEVIPSMITTEENCKKLEASAVRVLNPPIITTTATGNTISRVVITCVRMNESDMTAMNDQIQKLRSEHQAVGGADN